MNPSVPQSSSKLHSDSDEPHIDVASHRLLNDENDSQDFIWAKSDCIESKVAWTASFQAFSIDMSESADVFHASSAANLASISGSVV